MRTQFNKVLNLEPKIYNLSYMSLMGGAIVGITGLILYSLLGFFVGFLIGFLIGKKIGEDWWSGKIQRYMYWNLPAFFTLGVLGTTKTVPPSHVRRLF